MVFQNNFSKLRLQRLKGNRFSVIFYLNGKRYRYSDGKPLSKDIYPNKLESHLRESAANDLLYYYTEALRSGWIPQGISVKHQSLYDWVFAFEGSSSLSGKYIRELEITKNTFARYLMSNNLDKLSPRQITKRHFSDYLDKECEFASVFNHERQRLSAIIKRPYEEISFQCPLSGIPKRKTTQIMHKPFEDVNVMLNDVKQYNENLFLCCLLTYGCLLRPHKEIRNLTWSDFSDDLRVISLSGERNKSGRNRIVPVPLYVSKHLLRGMPSNNIFSGSEVPFNSDYFKSLWSRYKRNSIIIDPLQTLYSFRHSGAIEIYKRTGSLTTLQSAMGHASLAVTLGYLRGLEIPSLKLSDMPRL